MEAPADRSGSIVAWRPSESALAGFRSSERKHRLVALGIFLLAIVLAVIAYATWNQERTVFAHALRARATVLGTSSTRYADTIQVTFEAADGTIVRTGISVLDARAFQVGRPITVEYARSDPYRARTIRDWSPVSSDMLIYAIVALSTAAGLLIWDASWARRIHHALNVRGGGREMTAETIETFGPRGSSSLWVLLWRAGSPRGKPPDFTYRALPSTRRLLERTPVRVQGRLVLRSTVIAHAGDAALWPLGRLRRPGRKIRRERRSLEKLRAKFG